MRSTFMKASQLQQVIAKLARMLAQQGIAITQRGTGAYCKFNDKTGKAELINLPIIPPNPSEKFIAALHGYLDHEVAHALMTVSKDWNDHVRNPDATSSKGFRNSLINIVEDVRIENEMPKRFPGSTANLEAVRQFLIDEVWHPSLMKMNLHDASQEGKIRTVTVVPYLRAIGGHQACQRWVEDNDLARFFTQLHLAIPDLAERFQALKSTAEAGELADLLLLAIKPPKPEESDEPDEESDEEQSLGDESNDGDGGDEPDNNDDGKSNKEGGDKDRDDDKPRSRTKLGEAMKHLKPAQRKALFMYNKKKMDVEQIAEKMKISGADASRHLRDARRRLSLIMEGK